MAKAEQYPEEEILDETQRLVKGWGSVEVRDKDGELLPMEEFKKIMPVVMDRGGVIIDTHSNRVIGKILNYEFRQNTKVNKEGVLLTYKVFDNYRTDNEIWKEIKSGERRGLSFGGRNHDYKFEFNKAGGLENATKVLTGLEGFEFSSVKKPANQEGLNTHVNYLAKGEVEKPEDERPPKAWWDAAVRRAGSFADDPERFAGALWHNPEQFPGGRKLREAFGKSEEEDMLLKEAVKEFKKQSEDNQKMEDTVKKEDIDKLTESISGVVKSIEAMKGSVEKLDGRLDNLEKAKKQDEEEEEKKPEDEEKKKQEEEEEKKPEEEEKKKQAKVTLPADPGEDETVSGKPSKPGSETENFAEKTVNKKLVEDITKSVLNEVVKKGLSFGGEAPRAGSQNVKKTAGKTDDKDEDHILKVARGETDADIRKVRSMAEEERDNEIAKVMGGE